MRRLPSARGITRDREEKEGARCCSARAARGREGRKREINDGKRLKTSEKGHDCANMPAWPCRGAIGRPRSSLSLPPTIHATDRVSGPPLLPFPDQLYRGSLPVAAAVNRLTVNGVNFKQTLRRADGFRQGTSLVSNLLGASQPLESGSCGRTVPLLRNGWIRLGILLCMRVLLIFINAFQPFQVYST